MNHINVDWTKIPEEYKFVTVDKHGMVWGFVKKPTFNKGYECWVADKNRHLRFDSWRAQGSHASVNVMLEDFSLAIAERPPQTTKTVISLPVLLAEVDEHGSDIFTNRLINEGVRRSAKALEEQGFTVEFTKE